MGVFKITTMEAKFFTNLVRRISTKPTTNGEIKPFIYNRNPRNLERMRIERKPTGFVLEKDKFPYWHRLNIVQQSKYVTAQLIHNTEKVVVSASTNEWCIKQFLYSTTDGMAYVTLGKVFAERCLESGIVSFACRYTDTEDKRNISLFLKILRENDLILKEADVYDIHDIWLRNREKKPWTVLED